MLLGPSLTVSVILFSLGVAGVLFRRNAIAVNLSFIALAQQLGREGQVIVFFVMAVAAAEAAVGLAIMIGIYRHKSSLNVREINLLRG